MRTSRTHQLGEFISPGKFQRSREFPAFLNLSVSHQQNEKNGNSYVEPPSLSEYTFYFDTRINPRLSQTLNLLKPLARGQVANGQSRRPLRAGPSKRWPPKG
jgi:hypothetical protein